MADAQHVVFTVRTHLGCPVNLSTVAKSKDYGFVSAAFRNDSGRSIEGVDLRVSLSTDLGEEVIEGAGFYLALEPGQVKRLELGLGSMKEINERTKLTRKEITQVTLFVESVRFSDGTDWSDSGPFIMDQPPRPRQ